MWPLCRAVTRCLAARSASHHELVVHVGGIAVAADGHAGCLQAFNVGALVTEVHGKGNALLGFAM